MKIMSSGSDRNTTMPYKMCSLLISSWTKQTKLLLLKFSAEVVVNIRSDPSFWRGAHL